MGSQLDAINLEAFTDSELKELERCIEREQSRRERDRIKEAQRELRLVAAKYGVRPEDLLGGKEKTGSSGRKVPIKFRHPEDPAKAWSGRGRTPKWVEQWEASGGSRDQLRVDG
ncbi:H-NS histone family protein [Halorhodospira halochloris]|uniref:DNA-binding protein n=1 Tax=Halorhodospira halochloris TaxID=1052 RepID=A0A0X8XCL6_HALHR|nr:H-NS histone family protein [Halorhodospira halochloris]MBK1651948.1 hypothetical protein [Halorhodospira halochloris]MCG5530351.1 H-NS histone family protein [Halorhodospira halochloris]MCG5547943.1 H-NS histone family protein [Halorhodospira halochloris]BAU58239.1 DNA-binding protein [Halorhodospira halochloris]